MRKDDRDDEADGRAEVGGASKAIYEVEGGEDGGDEEVGDASCDVTWKKSSILVVMRGLYTN